MARLISRGIETIEGVESKIRTVDGNNDDDTLVDKSDLVNCDGLIVGSPTHFGNMAAPMKEFIDSTTEEWFNGTLISKPAGVFTSTSSMHGGQETTLMSMMMPLIHHGMIIVGVPYSEKKLSSTLSGGTPYGPTHVESKNSTGISDDEKEICINYGKRFAEICKKNKN
tara:strand:- start:1805 stop:2308 length:504 start_codon:yes stop_codon:yes gene_type:complete